MDQSFNKNHWYDGWFYDRIIAPNQDKLFTTIGSLMEPDSSVLDIGCGTGRLAFLLSGKCHSIVGIDLSKRNIERAKHLLGQSSAKNVSFIHGSVEEFNQTGQKPFDYAILTYVIHEISEKERITLLKDTAKIAKRIIIGDYKVPGPTGFAGFTTKMIEFLAGRDHYKNFRNYMSNGGISSIAEIAGLKIQKEIKGPSLTNRIYILVE